MLGVCQIFERKRICRELQRLESGDLPDQIESYHARYGFYPESVHAYKVYRTLDNRRYCRNRGIRISGPSLGRPKQVTELNKQALKALKCQQRQNETDYIAIEGKFGQDKRRFTLSRIMAKLLETSEAVIMISFIVMNLEKTLSSILLLGSCITVKVVIQSSCKGIKTYSAIMIHHMLCEKYCIG